MRRLIWLMLILGVVACSASPVAVSHVDLAEFSVTVDEELLQAGLVDLSIENYGQYPHTLVISTVEGSVLDATDLILAGEQRDLQIDLAPGEYMFTCRIVNSDGEGGVIDHYERGMSAIVEVVSPSA